MKQGHDFLKTLIKHKVSFQKLSEHHFRTSKYDFWPTTGVFMHRGTQERGKGLDNLLIALGVGVVDPAGGNLRKRRLTNNL